MALRDAKLPVGLPCATKFPISAALQPSTWIFIRYSIIKSQTPRKVLERDCSFKRLRHSEQFHLACSCAIRYCPLTCGHCSADENRGYNATEQAREKMLRGEEVQYLSCFH